MYTIIIIFAAVIAIITNKDQPTAQTNNNKNPKQPQSIVRQFFS